MILKAIEGNLFARLFNALFLLYSDFFYIDAVLNTVKDKGHLYFITQIIFGKRDVTLGTGKLINQN